jgi:2-hydroxychromene-2-carboxylate isomerase
MTEVGAAPLVFFYSVRSVYAYFAASRIADLARRHGRRIEHCPIDLSQVVPAFGSQPFAERAAKARALQFDLEVRRWSEYLELPVRLHPVHHHGDRLRPSALVLAAQEAGVETDRLATAILTALWRDDRDIADPEVLSGLVRECGIDPIPLMARAADPAMAAEFQRCTERAIAHGVPGSPSFLVDGELFYGQDRLIFVERQLIQPFGQQVGARQA